MIAFFRRTLYEAIRIECDLVASFTIKIIITKICTAHANSCCHCWYSACRRSFVEIMQLNLLETDFCTALILKSIGRTIISVRESFCCDKLGCNSPKTHDNRNCISVQDKSGNCIFACKTYTTIVEINKWTRWNRITLFSFVWCSGTQLKSYIVVQNRPDKTFRVKLSV